MRPGKGWLGRWDKGTKYGMIPGNTGRLVTLAQPSGVAALLVPSGLSALCIGLATLPTGLSTNPSTGLALAPL